MSLLPSFLVSELAYSFVRSVVPSLITFLVHDAGLLSKSIKVSSAMNSPHNWSRQHPLSDS